MLRVVIASAGAQGILGSQVARSFLDTHHEDLKPLLRGDKLCDVVAELLPDDVVVDKSGPEPVLFAESAASCHSWTHKGYCVKEQRSGRCPFTHHEGDRASISDAREHCRRWQAGHCPLGRSCHFMHDPYEFSSANRR